jgi:hypothetical protein
MSVRLSDLVVIKRQCCPLDTSGKSLALLHHSENRGPRRAAGGGLFIAMLAESPLTTCKSRFAAFLPICLRFEKVWHVGKSAASHHHRRDRQHARHGLP